MMRTRRLEINYGVLHQYLQKSSHLGLQKENVILCFSEKANDVGYFRNGNVYEEDDVMSEI